jgi:hypothetical protein
MIGLAASGLLLIACSNDNSNDDATESNDATTVEQSRDGAPDQVDARPGIDASLGCCPTGFILYPCEQPDGGSSFACHNPAMGCASSSICGKGCDPQVTGSCECVETQLCVIGDHFDKDLCRCVPTLDAGKPPLDAACIENVLCIRGDHFDTRLCRCVADGVDAGCPSCP